MSDNSFVTQSRVRHEHMRCFADKCEQFTTTVGNFGIKYYNSNNQPTLVEVHDTKGDKAPLSHVTAVSYMVASVPYVEGIVDMGDKIISITLDDDKRVESW